MAGELREGEIGALRNEAHTLRDFVRPDGPVKFAVDRKPAPGARYVYVTAVAGNLDVAVRVGNFDVAFPGIDTDVSRRAANLHVANAVRHVYRLRHVGDGDVAPLVSNRQRRLLRNRHVKIQADSRIARAHSSRTDFVAVAILHDFDANPIGHFLGIVLVPGLGIFLAGDSNLRLVRRTHADVAAAVAYCDARVCRNGFGRDLQVEVKTVSPLPKVAGNIFPAVINGNHYAKKTEKSQNKKNFARGNLRRARIARAAGSHALIQFDRAPKNQDERPPVSEHSKDVEPPVVVEQQQHSNEEQKKAGKK